MNLLIKVENGKPVNNPISEENLRFFIPNLDIENPPDGYARFIRKPPPELTPFQKIESVEYALDPDFWPSNISVYTDKYNIREFTDEEMIEATAASVRQLNEKIRINSNAPYPAPDDGNLYIWSQSSNSWHIMPSNFDDIMNRFTKKLQELGLAGMTAEQLQNIDEDKKQQLQQIADEINTP